MRTKKSVLNVLAGKSDSFKVYYRYAECLMFPQSFANSVIFQMSSHAEVKKLFVSLLNQMNIQERDIAVKYLNPETFNFRQVFEKYCPKVRAYSEDSLSHRSNMGQVLGGWENYAGKYNEEYEEPNLDFSQVLQILKIS